jgi:deoxycytidylate deaminase
VYYRAKNLAINNGRTYHIVAILKRNGNIIKMGENTNKTHPRFKRQYDDGTWGSHMHAEMNVLRFAQPGDELEVMRFKRSSHERTMAKPCDWCMSEIKKAGIKAIKYTNWSGEWEYIKIGMLP